MAAYFAAMSFKTHPTYPASRSYVLKLHIDAAPEQGRIVGRLENVATGEQFAFGSGDELLACLRRDAAQRAQCLPSAEASDRRKT